MLASGCFLCNVTTPNCMSNELRRRLGDRTRDMPRENGGKVVSFDWLQSAASWARRRTVPKLCLHALLRRVLQKRCVGPSFTGSFISILDDKSLTQWRDNPREYAQWPRFSEGHQFHCDPKGGIPTESLDRFAWSRDTAPINRKHRLQSTRIQPFVRYNLPALRRLPTDTGTPPIPCTARLRS